MNNSNLFTPKTLWQDFDAGLPLEASVTKKYSKEGSEVTELFFSGRACESGRPRIFGKFCRSLRESKEVVLILEDRNAQLPVESYLPLLEEFNLFFFDYAGENGRTAKHTYYNDTLKYANVKVAGDAYERAETSAKQSAVYEWVSVCRYAVSMAKSFGFEKIGLLGVREGGNLAIMTSALDERITCAVSCFGGGWGRYRNHFKFGANSEPELTEEFSRYVAGLEAQNYAHNVTCPFLMLSTSNNKKFQMDRINDTMSKMEQARFSFAPRLAGQFDEESGQDVVLFFRQFLSGTGTGLPEIPKLVLESAGGKLKAKLQPSACPIERAKVYYASNQCNPAIRDFRAAELTSGEAVLPIYEGEETLYAYPHVTYKNGYTLSGKLTAMPLADIKKESAAASQVLYTSAMGTDTFTTYTENVNTVFERQNVAMKKGSFNIEGIFDKYNRLATYKVNDARFRCSVDNLKFDLCTKVPQKLKAALYLRFGLAAEECFTAEVDALGGDMWQPVSLNVKDFKSEKGPLRSFAEVNLLVFRTEAETLFNNILWV